MAHPAIDQTGSKWFGRLVICTLLLSLGCADSSHVVVGETNSAMTFSGLDLIGLRVDSLPLRSLQVDSAVVVRFPQPGPVGLLLFDAEDCLSCVSLSRELLVLDRWVRERAGRSLGVVVGGDPAIALEYAVKHSIRAPITRTTGHLLQQAPHPVVVIMSSNGTILTVFDRRDWRTEDRPLHVFLRALD